MIPAVQLLDEMDEQMWTLFQKNLGRITEAEADWRPHPDANPVRWVVGHLAWYEEWAHGALGQDGRYLVDKDPTTYGDATIPELLARFTAARAVYRARIAALTEANLTRTISYFVRYDVTILALLETQALHLAGHRFLVRYIRGTYSRAHGTNKAAFDSW